MPPKTERFELRLDEDILSRVDQWRSQQGDLPTRAEAMRRLVETGLASTSALRLDDGDKLIVAMLCDIFKHLKIPRGTSETDSDFIASALYGGHYWGLEWKMPGLFHGHEDDRQNVKFVVDVLDMWSLLESCHRKLSKAEKALVERQATPFGKHPQFPGFDGNDETELFGITRFLVEKLSRFSNFEGRDLNSHFPVAAAYRRMLNVFVPMRKTLVGVDLSAAQIIEILQAREARIKRA